MGPPHLHEERLPWRHARCARGRDDRPRRRCSGRRCLLDLGQGGALERVPDDATAFTSRGAPYWIGAETQWDDPALDSRSIDWSRQAIAPPTENPYRLVSTYVNDVSDDADGAHVRSIASAKVERLVELKRTWDPDNVFRLNQNIRPSPGLDIPAARAR